MLAYLNKPKLKIAFVKEIEKHRKADQLLQGTYGEENGKWKGCAVACSLRSLDIIEKKKELETKYSNHSRYETELGIPRMIARLEDKIFEGLPKEEAMLWPTQFSEAINVGADLSIVMPKFFVWLLGDKDDGVINFAKGYKKSEKVIKGVLKLYQETVGGKVITKEAWRTAAYAAYAAYAAAAYAAYAAYAAAAYAADAAAYAYAYARKTSRKKHYVKMANKLLEILRETI